MANKIYKYTLPRGAELTAVLVKQFIDRHQSEDVPRLTQLESYFDDEPDRVNTPPNDIKANHNFAKYITHINNGYMLSNPVSYNFAKGVKKTDALIEAYKAQSIDDHDAELAESLSVFGRAYERIYVDEDSNIESTELDPKNTFVIYDNSVKHRKLYAVNYEPVYDDKGRAVKDQYGLTIIDPRTIRRYKYAGGNLVPSEADEPHFFAEVPVIEFPNNKRLKGDYESVLTLIDDYDILQSDRITDREELVDAILAFYGVKMTTEDKEDIKKKRTVGLPADAKGEYIVKDVDEAGADILRQTLAADIHKFSMTPDLSDKEFAGNSSGVAILYKLVAFFWNVGIKSRYFEAGLRERAVLYSRFLKTKSKMEELKSSDVDVVFNSILPKNDLETSQMINNLVDIVSKKTLVRQLSFVPDAEEEIKNVEAEAGARIDDSEFGKNEPDDQNKIHADDNPLEV